MWVMHSTTRGTTPPVWEGPRRWNGQSCGAPPRQLERLNPHLMTHTRCAQVNAFVWASHMRECRRGRGSVICAAQCFMSASRRHSPAGKALKLYIKLYLRRRARDPHSMHASIFPKSTCEGHRSGHMLSEPTSQVHLCCVWSDFQIYMLSMSLSLKSCGGECHFCGSCSLEARAMLPSD